MLLQLRGTTLEGLQGLHLRAEDLQKHHRCSYGPTEGQESDKEPQEDQERDREPQERQEYSWRPKGSQERDKKPKDYQRDFCHDPRNPRNVLSAQ